MTDHIPTTPGLPLGSDGCAWRSVAGAAAVRTAFASAKANAAGAGADVGSGNIASVYGPSVSIAA